LTDYKSGIYTEKTEKYFQGSRPDIVALIPGAQNRIIELGCGTGMTLLGAREIGKASEIVGIDIIGRLPQHDLLTRYYQGDIDTLPLDMERGSFDVAICADVLEHLVDPWSTLKKLSVLLKPGGTLIVSIPNARNYTLALKLLFTGDFQYQSEGLLDKGHLRFFCKKNMVQLVQQAGFNVLKFDFRLQKLRKILYYLSCGLLEQFVVKQYLIVARKG
jgi:2-polyprenyl-3-methyl-5-hydroxy-6-metoxy-1,4-benzoquinol methylase